LSTSLGLPTVVLIESPENITGQAQEVYGVASFTVRSSGLLSLVRVPMHMLTAQSLRPGSRRSA
jgi:hypothetical protein